MQNFSVDISTSHIQQVLYVKQGDSLSRFFALTVVDNGSPWEPPENAVYTIRFSTSAGSGWYDTIQLVGGTTRPAVSTAGNVLTCEVAEQATLGNGQLCVMVNDTTGYQLGTWNLNIIAEVVPGADSPEAEHYYGILAGQIAQVAKDAAAAAASATAAEKSAEEAKQSALVAKGHTVQNEDGSPMPQREALQFVGFNVADDPSGKTIVSPQIAGDTKNVAGYVGEITVFADAKLRENHVWADGGTIDPAKWPDLAAYAATAGWETDEGSGWYKTPVLSGTVYATGFDVGQMNAQIRAKVDIIEATVVEVNGDTLGGFTNGQVLVQQAGKLASQPGALKTYTAVDQLGLSGVQPVTAIFAAMQDGSVFLADNNVVSDDPVTLGEFTLLIVRANFYHGYAKAAAVDVPNVFEVMGINTSTGGLSGNWISQSAT